MLNKTQFIEKISCIKTPVYSITRKASYSNLQISENSMLFKRNNTGKYWQINLDELFEAYRNLDNINTKSIQQIVTGRVYSPACAFLIASGLYKSDGKRN